jgi:hypothetical protein
MEVRAHDLQRWLLLQPGWVSAAEICAHFHVVERELRTDGEDPGLCTEFAISGARGYRHVRNATRLEWLGFKFRLLRHAISEFRRVRHLSQVRHNITRAGVGAYRVEADSGQILLPV